jgi:hypothetical protein
MTTTRRPITRSRGTKDLSGTSLDTNASLVVPKTKNKRTQHIARTTHPRPAKKKGKKKLTSSTKDLPPRHNQQPRGPPRQYPCQRARSLVVTEAPPVASVLPPAAAATPPVAVYPLLLPLLPLLLPLLPLLLPPLPLLFSLLPFLLPLVLHDVMLLLIYLKEKTARGFPIRRSRCIRMQSHTGNRLEESILTPRRAWSLTRQGRFEADRRFTQRCRSMDGFRTCQRNEFVWRGYSTNPP